MDLAVYLFTILISFVGLSIGIALAFMAKEELKTGKRMFVILQLALMVVIIIFIFLYPRDIAMITGMMFLFGFPSGSLIIYERFLTKRISSKTYIAYSAVYLSFIIILSILQLTQ